MPGRIIVIADEETCTLFRLAGVGETYSVVDPDEARRILEQFEKGEDYVLALISDKIASSIDGFEELAVNLKMVTPITFPDRRGIPAKATDTLREIVKRAIGFEVAI
ncbi:MAG: V-type ATP synthase subunit F [Candidatus Bathyarchaeia archaeon]